MTTQTRLDPAAMVRPELRQFKPYLLDRSPCRHKLDQNEMPYDLPRALKRRIVDRVVDRPWIAYPGFNAETLCAALGRHCGWPADGILAGSGSGELLQLAVEATLEPGGEVLSHTPSFSLYKLVVARAHGVPRFLPPRDDLRLPLAELEREIERDPRRPVILCSPNNPTGEAATPEAVERLLDRLEAPLLLDNAYHEFCRHDYLPLLRRHRHLVLLRTLSKAWGLAGWRLGYLLADPALASELLKAKLPYNVNFASIAAGEAALDAAAAVDRRVRAVVGRRRQWRAMLETRRFEVFPSEANFLLVRCRPPWQVDAVRRGLDARGIRVRDMAGYPGLAGCFRISVGDGRALRDVAAALDEMRAEPRDARLDREETTLPIERDGREQRGALPRDAELDGEKTMPRAARPDRGKRRAPGAARPERKETTS